MGIKDRNKLNQLLYEDHSMEQIRKICDYIGNDASRFDEFWKMALASDDRARTRAAHALQVYLDDHPDIALLYTKAFIDQLHHESHPSMLRFLIRTLGQINELPEDDMSFLWEFCIGVLSNPSHQISSRVFSMDVLFTIVESYPDLGEELLLVLKTHIPDGSSGFKNHGKKIINKIILLRN